MCLKKLVAGDVPTLTETGSAPVMDNLNTHKLSSLYEAFEPAEARRIAERLEIHYTPKHRELVEYGGIEIGVPARPVPGPSDCSIQD